MAKGQLVQCGDVLELDSGDVEQPCAAADHSLSLPVVLLSDDVVIVDKPAGMPSAPRDGEELGCVANGLLATFPEMAQVGYGPLEPGLCHRLDNDTSGLILAARHAEAFDELTHAIRSGRVDKTYELICADGTRCDLEFEVELSLDEEEKSGWKIDVDMDDCALSYSGGSEDYRCPDLDDVIFRDDVIEGEFQIESLDCDLELEP